MLSGRLLDLLAGPIVRRATPSRVDLWCATSEPVRLEASIYVGARHGWDRVGAGNGTRVRLGRRLYVHLLHVVPRLFVEQAGHASTSFPVDRLLAYDVFDADDDGRRLVTAAAESGLTYGDLTMPTFVIQGHESLRLLFGSCRKPHGPGRDAIRIGDRELARTYDRPHERPQVLFLTGDQIYADDVPDALVDHRRRLAEWLTGHRESIPGMPVRPDMIPAGQRTKPVTQIAGLTSTHADNHLLSFGEFAAMYLMAWSDLVWTGFQPSRYSYREAQQDQIPGVIDYVSASMEARRLLANCATYMIFDDHEITDDWYMNEPWKERVIGESGAGGREGGRPAGRRVIANGLAAYWAFQAWGNDPRGFPGGLPDAVEGHLGEAWRGSGSAQAASRFEERLLNRTDWSFVAPTSPPTAFLDTRTGRRRTDSAAAVLTRPDTLRSIVARLAARSHRRGDPLVLVTAGPVFGFDALEAVQEAGQSLGEVVDRWGLGDEAVEALTSLLGGEGMEEGSLSRSAANQLDLESWRANLQSFIDFCLLMRELRPSCCVVLSGDVHYGFVASARIDDRKQGRSYPILQITSSPLKNQAPLPVMAAFNAARAAGGPGGLVLVPVTRGWWEGPPPGSASGSRQRGGGAGPPDFVEHILYRVDARLTTVVPYNNMDRVEMRQDGTSIHHRKYHINDVGIDVSFEDRYRVTDWPV